MKQSTCCRLFKVRFAFLRLISVFKKPQALAIILLLILIPSNSSIGQEHPEILTTKSDIRAARADTEMISIPLLPIEEYPLLTKFKRVSGVGFYRNGATDKKLRELSKVGLTNLQQINLLDCPLVTDDGMRALANIPSLRELGLEGTSITDVGLEMIATRLNLSGVNVANCTSVTRSGVRSLALCASLKTLSFSADTWTQEQVIELLESLKNVEWCGIVDPEGKLDASVLKARGKARGVQIVIKKTGALQDREEFRKRSNRR